MLANFDKVIVTKKNVVHWGLEKVSMEKQVYDCPSCGGKVELQYRFSKMAVCGFCNQTSFIEQNKLQAVGEKTELANYGSKLAIGASGTLNSQKFNIIGRIRFEYSGGFWDKWLLQLGENTDEEFWLQEDEGDLILYKRQLLNAEMPVFADTEVGSKYGFEGSKIFITEKHKATILGSEGELPYKALANQQADFIDGMFYGKGGVFNFEFLPEETRFYAGQLIGWNDIQVENAENPYNKVF